MGEHTIAVHDASRKLHKGKQPTPPEGDKLALEPVEFERLLRLEAELKVALLTKLKCDSEWAQLTLQRNEQIRQADAALREAEVAKQNVVSEVESRYSINMREWAYQTETGHLVRAPK